MASTGTFGWPTPDDSDFVRDGAAAIRALGDAADATLSGGFLYAGTNYFFANGTFDPADPLGTGDIGLRAVRVRLVGGGGGGGGCDATGPTEMVESVAGASGGYSERFVLASALGSSVTVTVGPGGSGGAAGSNTGTAGSTSSFGTLLSATGGAGGGIMPPTSGTQRVGGANPGIGSGGDINLLGNPSANAMVLLGERLLSSRPGVSILGGTLRSVTGNGINAEAFGNGGGAGISNVSAAARPGGSGSAGVVIVDCFV